MKHLIFLLLVSFTPLACDRATEQTQVPDEPEADILDKEAVKVGVYQMFVNVFHDVRILGLEGEFKYLDNSPEFFWVPPGYRSALDYDSVMTILEMNAKVITSVEYKWDMLEIFPLTNELANYSGIIKSSMTDTSGTTTDYTMLESGVLIKRIDGWKYLSGQTSMMPEEEKQQQ